MQSILKLTMSLLLIAVVASVGGCASRGPGVPEPDSKAFAKTKAPINLLDKSLSDKLGSDAASLTRTDDGRLKVAINIRNKSSKGLHVQARCVFKDDMGLSTGDETAWEEIYMSPRQSVTYRAESKVRNAITHTVEVRLPPKVKGKGNVR